MDKTFIVVKRMPDGDEFRYLTQAPDEETVRTKVENRENEGNLVNVVEFTKEMSLVRRILDFKIIIWSLSRELEQVLGRELDDLGNVTDCVCSGLDKPLGPTEYEKLQEVLENIKENA